MEKKKYTKPTVINVELNHEQAVLGTCSSGITGLKTGGLPECSITAGGCKQYTATKGDSAATS